MHKSTKMNKVINLITAVCLMLAMATHAQYGIQSRTFVNGFGDSYMKGVDGPSDVSHSFIKILESQLGITVNNCAEGGAGINYMLRRAWTPSTHVSAISATTTSLVQCGFNDAIRGGNSPKLLKKMQQGYVAFFANQFLATARPLSDATITKTGSWSNIGSTTNYPLKAFLSFGQTGRQSSTANDKVTFSITGSTLVVGYIMCDSSVTGEFGKFNVVVDGVIIGNVDTDNGTIAVSDPHYSNAYCPGATVFRNLGSGAHTVELVLTESKPVLLDYVGTLLPPSECVPVFVASIPKIDSIGYAGRANDPSDQTFDACTQRIWIAAKEFPGWPIVRVSLDEFISEDDLAMDHVHLGDAGHAGEADAFMSVLSQVWPRNYHVTTYTDGTGKTKMFAGLNARYNADGSFSRYDGTVETIGTIYNNTSTSSTVAIGELRAPSGASFSATYITRFDNVGRDAMTYEGTRTASGTGSSLSITIPHTCPTTPGRITILPRSADMKDYFVSTIGTTSFVVVIPASTSGTNNIVFDWKAEL